MSSVEVSSKVPVKIRRIMMHKNLLRNSFIVFVQKHFEKLKRLKRALEVNKYIAWLFCKKLK